MNNSQPIPEIDDLLAYIDDYWSKLVRHNREDNQTLIGLPHPYLVPASGEMFQEMYYWDSFFMGLGVIGTPYERLIVDMTRNMVHLYKRFGIIPNASRYYFLSRSQPPFLTKMIWLAYEVLDKDDKTAARDFLRETIEVAESEHESVWMGRKQPHHRLMQFDLSRYFDINYLDILASCESGWDHSTRCDDRWMRHLPVDLNAILYAREMDIKRAWELLGNSERSQEWHDKALSRAAKINSLMWDEESGFFFDFDLDSQTRNPTSSLAGFIPMWAGLATQSQSERMVETWLPKFDCTGGLVTSLDAREDRQWAYPNGWAPLQWLVAEGLDRYGFRTQAHSVRKKWLVTCTEVFQKTGSMWEKYNVVAPDSVPEEGVYGSIEGFGWSNAVVVDFARKLSFYKRDSANL